MVRFQVETRLWCFIVGDSSSLEKVPESIWRVTVARETAGQANNCNWLLRICCFRGSYVAGRDIFQNHRTHLAEESERATSRSLNSEADFTYFVDSERVQAQEGQNILARRRWNESQIDRAEFK
jgi:hypothetical protein